MSDFLKLKSGLSINPEAITVIDFSHPPSVVLQVGSSSVTAEGDDAEMLRSQYGPPKEDHPSKKGAEAPGDHATQAKK